LVSVRSSRKVSHLAVSRPRQAEPYETRLRAWRIALSLEHGCRWSSSHTAAGFVSWRGLVIGHFCRRAQHRRQQALRGSAPTQQALIAPSFTTSSTRALSAFSASISLTIVRLA